MEKIYETLSSQGCSAWLKDLVVQSLFKQYLSLSTLPSIRNCIYSVRVLADILPYVEKNGKDIHVYSRQNIFKVKELLAEVVYGIERHSISQLQSLHLTTICLSYVLVSILRYDYARFSKSAAMERVVELIKIQIQTRPLQQSGSQSQEEIIQFQAAEQIPDWLLLLNVVEKQQLDQPGQISDTIRHVFQINSEVAQDYRAQCKDVIIRKNYFTFTPQNQGYLQPMNDQRPDQQASNDNMPPNQTSSQSNLGSTETGNTDQDQATFQIAIERLYKYFENNTNQIRQQQDLLVLVMDDIYNQFKAKVIHNTKNIYTNISKSGLKNKTVEQLQYCIKKFLSNPGTLRLDDRLLAHLIWVGNWLDFLDDSILTGIHKYLSKDYITIHKRDMVTPTHYVVLAVQAMTSMELRSKFKLGSLKKDGTSQIFNKLQACAAIFVEFIVKAEWGSRYGIQSSDRNTIVRTLMLIYIYDVKQSLVEQLLEQLQRYQGIATLNLCLRFAVLLNYKGELLPNMISELMKHQDQTLKLDQLLVYLYLCNYDHVQKNLDHQLVLELQQRRDQQIDQLAQLDATSLQNNDLKHQTASYVLLLLNQMDGSSSDHEAACQSIAKYLEGELRTGNKSSIRQLNLLNNIIATQKIREQRTQPLDGNLLLLALEKTSSSKSLDLVDQDLLIYAQEVVDINFNDRKDLLRDLNYQIIQNNSFLK